MSDIGDQMGKMVGPLPLGAWLALVGGGLGLAYWTRQNATDTSEPGRDTSLDEGVGEGGSGQWIDLNPPAANTPVNTKPVDNDEWANLAMTWFQANNYDMATAGQAVANYLSGHLTTADVRGWALIRTVMMHIGAPPNVPQQDQPTPGIPKPPVVKPPVKPPIKPPAPKPQPKPQPHKRYYVVRKGDTLTSIGRKYGKSWQSIFNANRSILSNPNRIYPGQKLLIPN